MRFNKLDLNLLAVLNALLITRSVTRAAERLFLSQPATSLSLGRLREYFQDELLVPVGKTFVLTPLAEELALPVRDVLLQIQTITRTRPAFDPATSTRRFTIESSDYVISVLLSKVVREAALRAPHMQFDLRALSPQTPEHLENGDTEVLIAPDFALVPGHPGERLFEDSFSCVGCAVAFADVKRLTADRYFASAHVGIEWGGGRRLTYDARFVSTGKRVRRQEVIAPNFTLVPQLVAGTSRIATLPTRLARQMADRFDVKVYACPVDVPGFTETMQWQKYQERDPAIVWLRALLHEVAGAMDETPMRTSRARKLSSAAEPRRRRAEPRRRRAEVPAAY